MRKVNNLDLWIYTPQCSGGRSGKGGFRRPVNVHVVYGHEPMFHNIMSKMVTSTCVVNNVDSNYTGPRSAFGIALREANRIYDDFDLFLDRVIGTHDKRGKEYKEFVRKVENFKGAVMRSKIEGN